MVIAATIACTCVAEKPGNTNDKATTADARMQAWDQHVKLRQSSIFKDVAWLPVGPRIQGGKIESIWSVKKRKSTLFWITLSKRDI